MAEVPVTVVFPALLRYNMAMKNDAVKTEDSVTITRSEYENLLTLKSANAYLESANRWLEEQLKVLKDKIYGAKSEKASEEVNGQMCLLFDEPEVYAFLEEFQKGKTNVAEHQNALCQVPFSIYGCFLLIGNTTNMQRKLCKNILTSFLCSSIMMTTKLVRRKFP
mgnify:CR=1 FL=1